jgi:N utilization substance protein A
MPPDFLVAIKALTSEKGLPEDTVFEAVEAALAAAYKRDNDLLGTVFVEIDRIDGAAKVWSEREVVEVEEDIADEDLQIDLEAAQKIQAAAKIGDTLHEDHVIPETAGRIAAQTAKQVVLQRLREAERESVFDEYSGQEGELVSGLIQRVESRQVILDLGKTEALLPVSEQVRMEHYRAPGRLRVYVVEVQKSNKGPQIIVSRTHKNLIRRLFELEVPEIFKGIVDIRAIAREPGHRTKIAVQSRQEGVDPIGACVGMRGSRIQNVVNELQGERIDVVQWDADPRKFVAHALSPAQVSAVRIEAETNTAEIAVPDAQLTLAIGKQGQNARLAARLTGMRIDIKPQSLAEKLMEEEGIGPFAPAPEPEMADETVAEAEVAVDDAAAAEAEPETVEAVAGDPSQHDERDDAYQEGEDAEEAAEPVLAAVEVAPRRDDSGKIRFAEDVLRRADSVEDGSKKKKRRRDRYVETNEGLDEDPYAEYEEEYAEDL